MLCPFLSCSLFPCGEREMKNQNAGRRPNQPTPHAEKRRRSLTAHARELVQPHRTRAPIHAAVRKSSGFACAARCDLQSRLGVAGSSNAEAFEEERRVRRSVGILGPACVPTSGCPDVLVAKRESNP